MSLASVPWLCQQETAWVVAEWLGSKSNNVGGNLEILCPCLGVASLWFEPSKYVGSVSNGYQAGPLGPNHKHLRSFFQNLRSFFPFFFFSFYSSFFLDTSVSFTCIARSTYCPLGFSCFVSSASGTQELSCEQKVRLQIWMFGATIKKKSPQLLACRYMVGSILLLWAGQ